MLKVRIPFCATINGLCRLMLHQTRFKAHTCRSNSTHQLGVILWFTRLGWRLAAVKLLHTTNVSHSVQSILFSSAQLLRGLHYWVTSWGSVKAVKFSRFYGFTSDYVNTWPFTGFELNIGYHHCVSRLPRREITIDSISICQLKIIVFPPKHIQLLWNSRDFISWLRIFLSGRKKKKKIIIIDENGEIAGSNCSFESRKQCYCDT